MFLLSTKQTLMTKVERGGTIGTYSSGVKMTLKVGLRPVGTNETRTFQRLAFILFAITIGCRPKPEHPNHVFKMAPKKSAVKILYLKCQLC